LNSLATNLALYLSKPNTPLQSATGATASALCCHMQPTLLYLSYQSSSKSFWNLLSALGSCSIFSRARKSRIEAKLNMNFPSIFCLGAFKEFCFILFHLRIHKLVTILTTQMQHKILLLGLQLCQIVLVIISVQDVCFTPLITACIHLIAFGMC